MTPPNLHSLCDVMSSRLATAQYEVKCNTHSYVYPSHGFKEKTNFRKPNEYCLWKVWGHIT